MPSYLVCVGLALFSAAGGGGNTVEVILDPPIIPFHRQATFTIVTESTGEYAPQLKGMIDRFGGLDVYGMPEYEVEHLRGGRLRVSETYTLDPVFVGTYFIEPVTVSFGDDEQVTVASPVLRVRDLTEAERKEALLFDDSLPGLPPGSAGAWWRNGPAWVVAGVLAAVLLALPAWWRRRSDGDAPAPVPKTPWEIALERLRLLEGRKLSEAGKFGSYYVDLSAILRYYVEARFHLHAPERSTPEFLAESSDAGVFEVEEERVLASLLRHCDLVKFAQYQPTAEEMNTSFTQVTDFVEGTIPEIEVNADEEGVVA